MEILTYQQTVFLKIIYEFRMGKGACIEKMVAVRSYSTNTIMEKTNKGGRRGWGKGYGIFRDKVKNLKIFLE